MTKRKIKEVVQKCLKDHFLCRAYFKYDMYYWYLIPLLISDKLFLSTKEDDFLLDGYSIRRFRDVDMAEIKKDLCYEILRNENILNIIVTPDIDISDWETTFRSLFLLNQNIIVEKESKNDDESEFIIGRIEKVFKNFTYVRHFDADGIW